MPDAVLLYGDTNSCLAVIAAKRRKIPVFHMEAGNRCFDQRVPQLNRKVLGSFSDVNLVLTEHARRYLRGGYPWRNYYQDRFPYERSADYYSEKISKSSILSELKLKKQNIFSVHIEKRT